MKKARRRRERVFLRRLTFLFVSLFFFFSCSEVQNSGNTPETSPSYSYTGVPQKAVPENYALQPQNAFTVLNSFPHDPSAFTQGLVYRDGFLYESTGLYGKSFLKRSNPATGKVLVKTNLSRKFFGEGITIMGNRIYQLTWKSGQGFIYERESLKRLGSFTYLTEGWGLTDDRTQLIMSDGTEKLYFLSPENFNVTRVLTVKENGVPVAKLNELEYAEGKIYCNIWHSDDIVVVDPESGAVEKRINLGQLRERLSLADRAGVLNGIAWRPSSGTFFVTGKNWSEVFE
ncbi:MAG: glutaminyl-peptide cyclotransferase, partial [Candidatus Dadabacteria bacterium]|nr:glutaminyl-peptide cyclotransferase [Candidatus Dadabacteria bacterium]